MGVLDTMESLKKRIHSYRIPLSPKNQRRMLFVYCSIPFFVGTPFMWWLVGREERNRASWQDELKRGGHFTPPSPQMTIADLSRSITWNPRTTANAPHLTHAAATPAADSEAAAQRSKQ
jgi:hypothetical protein